METGKPAGIGEHVYDESSRGSDDDDQKDSATSAAAATGGCTCRRGGHLAAAHGFQDGSSGFGRDNPASNGERGSHRQGEAGNHGSAARVQDRKGWNYASTGKEGNGSHGLSDPSGSESTAAGLPEG